MTEAHDQLQKLTECCICFKTFTDPRMLPCIHTFCLECLKQTGKSAKKNTGENMPCPLCRKLFVIPTEGMNGLQRNFFMQHLIEVTNVIKVGQQLITNCDICKALHEGDAKKTKEASAQATMRCLECGDNFCDMCARTHKLHKSSKTHSIMKIGGETAEDIRKMQTTRNCAVHNQQPLSFYCADCKKIICVSCFVENHASHICKDVISVEKEFRQTIGMNASKISNFSKEILSKRSKEEKSTTGLLLILEETEKQIRKRNVKLKEMIDSHTNSLLLQLSQIKQKRVEDISAEKEEIERIYTILKSFEIYCTELSSKGSPCDVCSCVDELVKRTNELEKDHEAFLGPPSKNPEVSFKATDWEQLISTPQDNTVGQIIIHEEIFQHGLTNTRGNNYFNAVIQCLYQTTPIENVFCSRGINAKQPLTDAFVTFLNPIYKLLSEKEACFNFGDQLFKSSPKFSNFRRYDNHDLFIEFLNILRSEERDGLSAVASEGLRDNPAMEQYSATDWTECENDSYIDIERHLTAVDEIFGGHSIAECVCLNCKQLNFICESLLDVTLSISIPTHQNFSGIKTGGDGNRYFEQPRVLQTDTGQPFYRGVGNFFTQASLETGYGEQLTSTDARERYMHLYKRKPITLTDCLTLYTLAERITESHRCTFCQDEQEAAAAETAQTTPSVIKCTLIYDPPAVLVLHLKRFEKTITGFTKLSDKIYYYEYLDLGPYCSSDCQRIDPEDKNVWYSLYGVVVHKGSFESGHYASYLKIKDSNPCAIKTDEYLQKTYVDCDMVSSKQLNQSYITGRKTQTFSSARQPKSATNRRWIFTDDVDTREATLQEALDQEAFMLFYERIPNPCQQL